MLKAVRELALQMQVMDQVHDSVIATDLDGIIASWNRGAERLHEYRADEAIGQHISMIYAPEERQHLDERRCGPALASGFAEYDAVALTKTGRRHQIHTRVSLIRDRQDRPAGFLSFSLDTSDLGKMREELRERERRLRTILDAIPLQVAHISRDERILFANRAWEEVTGPCVGVQLGQIIPAIFGENYYQATKPVRERVLRGVPVETTEDLALPKLGRRTFDVHRIPDIRADGSVEGWFVVCADVTEKRRTEEDRLSEERRLRDALVAEVHHRVKNSLQSVVGLLRAQLLQYPQLGPILGPAVSQVLAVSVGFGLLGNRNRPGVILCDMVREIGGNLAHITGAAIETSFDESIAREPVVLDAAQAVNTSLVLNELLFNAVKHGAPGDGQARVTVRLSRDEQKGTVQIFSAGAVLPAHFDFAAGTGVRTGLSLVRLLLQPGASALKFETTPAGVEVTLEVKSAGTKQAR